MLGRGVGACCLIDCTYLELDVPSLKPPKVIGQARALYRYLREQRIGIFHSFFQDASILGQPVAWAAGVPVRVVSFRDLGFWRTTKSEWMMRGAIRFATGLLANSESVKREVVARDGVSAGRFTVIENGLDPAAIPFREEPTARPTIVFVGNLNREVKRPDLFVESARLIAGEFPDAEWWFVGDGRLRPGLEARVNELGLSERFHFLGARQDVVELLRSATVGVNCSDSEGLPNSVIEYMLAGAAVVASDVGGNRDVVASGRTGLLVPAGDAGALADGIASVLRDPVRADGLRRRARLEAVRRFSWDACVQAHQDYYGRQLAR